MFGDDLSVRISAKTASFERKVGSAKDSVGDLGREALQTSAAMQALQGRTDEAGDEISETGRDADRTKRSLFGMAAAAGSAQISFGSLSVATAVSLVPSLLTLATVLAPITAAFIATAAGAGALLGAFGALLGAGMLSWGRDLASQMEGVSSATEALAKVAGRLKDRLVPIIAPLGDAFVPLLQDAALALPVVVQEMVNAVGGTEQFRQAMRDFGRVTARVLPALTSFLFDFAREAMPVARDFFNFLLAEGGGAFDAILASVRELAPEWNSFLDSVIRFLPVLLEFGTNVAEVVLPALTTLIHLSTEFMTTINMLPGVLQDIATAGLILAPIITSLGLKIAGLAATLSGSGGLIGLISGSGGVAAALTALTGPVGIAIAAIGVLAAAWAFNLGNMRTNTMRWAKDVGSIIKGTFGSLKGSLNDDTPWAVGPASEEAVRERREDGSESSGPELPGGESSKYLKQLEKLQNKDFSKSFLSPSNFQSQGEQAGQAAAKGIQQGMSKTEMQAEVIGDKQELASLRLMFKEAQSLPRKKELLKKMQAIRNPKNMNQPEPTAGDQIRRQNQGGKTTTKARGKSSIVQAGQTFNKSGRKIKNVASTFESAVNTFKRTVENMEIVVSVDDGEFAGAIDARIEQNGRQTAQQAENYGEYQP